MAGASGPMGDHVAQHCTAFAYTEGSILLRATDTLDIANSAHVRGNFAALWWKIPALTSQRLIPYTFHSSYNSCAKNEVPPISLSESMFTAA